MRLLSLTGSQTEFVLASIDGSTKVQVEVAVSSVPDAELSLANGSVILDWQRWTITHGANRVTLSRTELRLLAALMEKAPAPASREQLVSRLWPTDPSRTSDRDGAVAVWVFALRKRFAAIGLPDAIRTVRSIGYCLDL